MAEPVGSSDKQLNKWSFLQVNASYVEQIRQLQDNLEKKQKQLDDLTKEYSANNGS